MEKPKCPYMDSGICYRRGCIYLPHLKCMKVDEIRHKQKKIKRKNKHVKKHKRILLEES